ncbi:hypothetical protein OV090_02475 [Nannocystis sp. RBIL2]|uniref:hypothetical protein n=1 Tax=Nannocystis sp. RBIL2 TaxID=2996788 RepID=UPI0022716F98|nr:hypothetical protein [Nannocystis sp. RBIL2]MCY1063607.1 hypothetical protein [Nannocystis sp. RBIL2]
MRPAFIALLLLACRPDTTEPPATAAAPPPNATPERPASPPPANTIQPDRLCVVTTPERHGLMAEFDCTCGESFACRTARRGDTLELAFERMPSPAICDECFPSRTPCALDRLAPGEHVRVTLDGRELGALTAKAAGWLPAGTCLQGS